MNTSAVRWQVVEALESDLLPQCRCEFLLDYDEEDEGTGGSGDAETLRPGDLATGASSPSPQVSKSQSRRKKPWRYRWPDEIRDEVLARLLKLNAERAEQERLAGLAAAAASPPKRRKGETAKRRGGATASQGDLRPPPQGDLFS